MRTIYVDDEARCHVTDDGTMTAIETDFFDGKCDAFVQGHCYEVNGDETSIYPWKPLKELAAAQTQYERDNAELLKAYEEGVNSAYD